MKFKGNGIYIPFVVLILIFTNPIFGQKKDPYKIKRSDLEKKESELTNSPQFKLVKLSIATRSQSEVDKVQKDNASNPENVKRVEKILPEKNWQEIFPMRNSLYTYRGFLQAVAKFKGFCQTYTDGRNSEDICRKSLVTIFAHFTQETGGHDKNSEIEEWRQGLVFLRESGCNDHDNSCQYNKECDPTTWQGKTWPCGKNPNGKFLKYYGRGAKQLSYNYNYGPFSDFIFNDIRPLLDDPDKVAKTWLNLASAIFFFIYPAPPKPSMLHVVDGTWQPNEKDRELGIRPGFGATTNIINGGIECGHGHEKPQSLNRISYFESHGKYLQIKTGENEELGCKNQKAFSKNGAGALEIYWEQDWSYDPSKPGGRSYACKLVGYQTPFNALKKNDYIKCVQKFFDIEVIEQ